MQLMTNAIQLLMVSRIFHMREFEDWEATPNKTYNSLKLFVHGAYAHQLVAIQLRTTGHQGYVAHQHNHNMYNVLEDGALVTDDKASITTIIQQTAANITTGSTLAVAHGQSFSISEQVRCGGRGNQPTIHQQIGDVVAHAKFVVA